MSHTVLPSIRRQQDVSIQILNDEEQTSDTGVSLVAFTLASDKPGVEGKKS